MKIVRAKNNKNKLKVFDNRPFIIDIELQEQGFKVNFLDLKTGDRYICFYANRELFDIQWKLYQNVSNEEDIFYEIINYYQE